MVYSACLENRSVFAHRGFESYHVRKTSYMSKHASPELKRQESSSKGSYFSYPGYYRQDILRTVMIGKNILSYMLALGLKPGRLDVSSLCVLPRIDIFGFVASKFRFVNESLINKVTTPILFSELNNKLDFSCRGIIDFCSSSWFSLMFKIGLFRRLSFLLFYSLILPSSNFEGDSRLQQLCRHAYYWNNLRIGRDMFCELLARIFFRLRSEYFLSRFLYFDALISYNDYGLLDDFSNRFARIFLLPFYNFRNKFKSVRSQSFIKLLFSGFFFIDFDIVIRQLSLGLSRAGRRQFSYVYRVLPLIIHFSSYYNTVVRGFRLRVRGKLGGRTRTRVFVLENFRPSPGFYIQSFCAGISYKFSDGFTYTGVFGLHTYVYIGHRVVSNYGLLES